MWAPGSQWNQMPLDAASYQNVNHDLVDWASLAQQWIRMREAHESAIANVPGMIHGHIGLPTHQKVHHMPEVAIHDGINGGEAPMDVEKDEEHTSIVPEIIWTPQQVKPQIPPCWVPQNPVRMGVPMQAGVLPSGLPHPAFITQVVQPNIAAGSSIIRTPHVGVSNASEFPRPPLLLHSSRQGSSDEDSNGLPSSAGSIDAAKRKNLPAWIREGLEKMEREKQKREERENFLREREFQRKKQLLGENESGVVSSRFDTSEESDLDADDSENEEESVTRSPQPSSSHTLSSESMMLLIRQLMTEILLEVTTEEVRIAAVDACQLAKVKSRQVLHSMSSKSLTQKLGLDQYGSDSDEDNDGEDATTKPAGNQEYLDANSGKLEQVEPRKASSSSGANSNRSSVDMSISRSETDVNTKVEMDNGSLGHNGAAEVGRALLKEKEFCARDPKIEGTSFASSTEKDSQPYDSSSRKEEKCVSRRSGSRDHRRRSRSRDRHSRRHRERERSRSSRRSRSRGRRSSSRDNHRTRSRDRKRSRTRHRSSSGDRRKNSRARRASSRDRSRSSSRSRKRNSRRSRS